ERRSERDFHADQPLRCAVDGARFGQHGAGAMHLPVSDDIQPLGHVYSLLSRRPGGLRPRRRYKQQGRLSKWVFYLGSATASTVAAAPQPGYRLRSTGPSWSQAPTCTEQKSLTMLQSFRNFFRSKIGIVVTLAFLALIAIAFASSDVANTGTFGGIAG